MNTRWIDKACSGLAQRAETKFWQAMLARDRRADGSFVFAVRSTHIYCRPSCPARRPLRKNALFFRSPKEAEQSGFRPCQRCRPQEQQEGAKLVRRAANLLARENEERPRLEELAAQLGSSSGKLRRAFRRTTGLSPRQFVEACRLNHFKKLLREGKEITEALYQCGFGSPSRIYEKTSAHLGMTPAAYRKGGTGMEIGYAVAKSSLGIVLVAATDRGISAVYLGEKEKTLVTELRREYPRAAIHASPGEHEKWIREIVKRVEGDPPSLELPLDVQATAFQRRVWQELQKIPVGATRSYSQMARALGRPSSVRAVARACATNPVSIVVPCHRVIRRDGQLAGYRWGIQRKEKLLEREGARSAVGRETW
jgi:AraC family transcriptional regulator, regulatory protein of adaptative response / methylated-DNA-[protein]-cysteine methyltransferase